MLMHLQVVGHCELMLLRARHDLGIAGWSYEGGEELEVGEEMDQGIEVRGQKGEPVALKVSAVWGLVLQIVLPPPTSGGISLDMEAGYFYPALFSTS